MHKRNIFLIILLSIAILFIPFNVTAKEKYDVNIYIYTQVGCSNCHNMLEFLNELDDKYDNVHIHEFLYNYKLTSSDEGYEESKNYYEEKIFFDELYELENSGFPLTLIGGKCYLGSNNTIKKQIESSIDTYSNNEHIDIYKMFKNGEEIDKSMLEYDTTYELPILGKVTPGKVSLLLTSIVIGLLDGFNPCGMWVLLFILTLLLQTNNKKKMWILGGAFILTSAVFYFAMMMSWMTVITGFAGNKIFLLIVGIIAIGIGGYNIFKYIKSKVKKEDGCDVQSVEQKRKLSKRIKEIISKGSIWVAIGGIILITLLVNLFELACSAGYPLIYSVLLKASGVSMAVQILYTLVYVLFFVIDDLIIFFIAVITMNIKAVSNKLTKYAYLIGGILMLLFGILMIFFPNFITNPFGG